MFLKTIGRHCYDYIQVCENIELLQTFPDRLLGVLLGLTLQIGLFSLVLGLSRGSTCLAMFQLPDIAELLEYIDEAA